MDTRRGRGPIVSRLGKRLPIGCDSNARFAAAPDMLEALESFVAIAKAKGETE